MNKSLEVVNEKHEYALSMKDLNMSCQHCECKLYWHLNSKLQTRISIVNEISEYE